MRRKLRVCPGALVALLLWVTGPLEGQETIRGEVLPEEVAADVLGFVNDPGTLRFEGDGRVPSGQSIQGNVALVGGLLTVAGEIRGDLVILNGDLVLLPSAVITGDVLIVGGEVAEGDADAIQGLVSIYERAYPVVRRDGGVYPRTDRRRERPGIYLGGSRITIRSGSGYNRVEGLPILVGPLFRTSGDYPLRVEALAIFRTESGFSLDNLGYTVRLEQSFGAAPRWTLGAGAASEVVPIQGRGVSDLEASLSTFLLHRDNRDYLSREGWFLSLAADFESIPLRTSLTFRADDHYSTTPGSPWTLFRNDEEWRPMPLVAEGDLRTLEAQVEIDRRNDPDNPTDGWFLEASLTHGLDGDLFLPAYIAAGATAPEGPTPVDPRFTFGSLDLRRYARIDPNSDLRFRLLLQGALQSDALLPQFQSALRRSRGERRTTQPVPPSSGTGVTRRPSSRWSSGRSWTGSWTSHPTTRRTGRSGTGTPGSTSPRRSWRSWTRAGGGPRSRTASTAIRWRTSAPGRSLETWGSSWPTRSPATTGR
ncbi:MAG: polymer-forming cytoskeletal protein [Gemmatimonadota bacterium]